MIGGVNPGASRWCAAGAILIALISAGCASPGDATRYLARVIPQTPANSVQRQAELLLRREFGRVTVDSAAGRLETSPTEFVATSGSGSSRELYGGPANLRRKAVMLIESRGPDALARLRIDVEREDTLSQETMHPGQNRLSDSPAYTSIERDAATTPTQNRVWTYVRRDRALERQLLDELSALFGADSPSPTAPGVGPGSEVTGNSGAEPAPAPTESTPVDGPPTEIRTLEPVPTDKPQPAGD